MTAGSDCFLDTNVLVYAALGRVREGRKGAIAGRTVLEANFGTPAQFLAEFYTVVTKKAKPPLTPPTAARWVRALAKKPCLAVDAGIVKAGIGLSQRYQISYWDGAILSAAEALGSRILYSEDLSHGQVYGSVKVVNPFLESAQQT